MLPSVCYRRKFEPVNIRELLTFLLVHKPVPAINVHKLSAYHFYQLANSDNRVQEQIDLFLRTQFSGHHAFYHRYCGDRLKNLQHRLSRILRSWAILLFNWTVQCKELHKLIDASQCWDISHYQIPVIWHPNTSLGQLESVVIVQIFATCTT